MVNYNSSDIISLSDFGYNWRIGNLQWDLLPITIQQKILPLSSERSAQVCLYGSTLRNKDIPCVNGNQYHVQRSISLSGNVDVDIVADWLNALPISFNEEIYVTWGSGLAIITRWDAFIQSWDSLWYPFDVVNVFDDSMTWGTLFGPEEFAAFVEQGGVDEPSSDGFFLLGHELVKADE